MPFIDSVNSEYIYLSEKHLEALASLKYAAEHGKGFLMLTGEPGTGKTSIVRKFINEISDTVIFANLTNPQLDITDFFMVLADEFGLDTKIRTKKDFLSAFKKFLNKAHKKGKNVLLIIDEAHELPQHLYEEVRLLTNIDTRGYNMLNIFFVGQTRFKDIILETRNYSLRQRIYINYFLEPLSEEETAGLVIHRLRHAGAKSNLFSSNALHAIYEHTAGYPRLIVDLCHRALLKGASKTAKLIDKDIIDECANDIKFLKVTNRKTRIDVYKKEHLTTEYIPKDKDQNGLNTIISSVNNKIRELNLSKLTGLKRWSLAVVSALLLLTIIGVGAYLINRDSETEALLLSKNEKKIPTAESDIIITSDRQPPKNLQENTYQKSIGHEDYQNTSSNEVSSFSKIDESQISVSKLETKVDSVEQKSLPSYPENASKIKTYDNAEIIINKTSKKTAQQVATKQVDKTEQITKPELKKTTVGADKRETTENRPMEFEKAKSPVKPTPIKKMEAVANNSIQPDKKVPILAENTIHNEAKKESDTNPVAQIDSTKDLSTLKMPEAEKAEVTPKDSSQASYTNIDKVQKTKEAAEFKEPLQGEQKFVRQAEPKKETAMVLEDKPVSIPMENKLQVFLKKYCDTYASKKLVEFLAFFSSDASENGVPLSSLIPKYRRNFDAIETIKYDIALENFSYDKVSDIVKIGGQFFLKWKPYNKDWRENSGKIFMDLIKDDDSFTVVNLKYYGTQKKNDSKESSLR